MIFVPGHGFQPLIPGIMSTHVSIVRATGTKHNHATLSEIIVPVTLQGLVLAKGVILVCSMGLVLLPPFRWWKLGPAISTTWVKASIIYLTQKITQRKPLEFQPVPSNFPSMFHPFPACFLRVSIHVSLGRKNNGKCDIRRGFLRLLRLTKLAKAPKNGVFFGRKTFNF